MWEKIGVSNQKHFNFSRYFIGKGMLVQNIKEIRQETNPVDPVIFQSVTKTS